MGQQTTNLFYLNKNSLQGNDRQGARGARGTYGLLLFLGATWKSVEGGSSRGEQGSRQAGWLSVFGVSVPAKRNYHVHLHNLAYVVVVIVAVVVAA